MKIQAEKRIKKEIKDLAGELKVYSDKLKYDTKLFKKVDAQLTAAEIGKKSLRFVILAIILLYNYLRFVCWQREDRRTEEKASRTGIRNQDRNVTSRKSPKYY